MSTKNDVSVKVKNHMGHIYQMKYGGVMNVDPSRGLPNVVDISN